MWGETCIGETVFDPSLPWFRRFYVFRPAPPAHAVDSIPAAAFLIASELPSMVECRKLNDMRAYKTETHATATFGMLPAVIQQIPGVYELRRIELVALLALLCLHPLSFAFTHSPLSSLTLLCSLMVSTSRALAFVTFFAASSLAASVIDWQRRSIYQVYN